MRILLSETTGLVIDVQTKFAPHIAEYDKILERILILIKGLNALGAPIAVTEQNNEKLGSTVPEITEILGSFKVMNKFEFSCYDHKPYKEWLNAHPCKNVIIFGIETHVCVLQTAIDLKEAGYQAIVVWDAVSSRSLENKAIALERFRSEGVLVVSSESILFELTRSFDHPEARTISGLVK